ncbi:siderophore-iron reductase FhuF [Variovorax sp. YR566]|uniref:siderophore-iron reductase FhuF n=1 Tax=Variovorax sp. YR566 TaxID=3450237 RepID=UPI003F7D4BD6
MIAMLEPLFQGNLAPHGEALQCAPQPPAGALRVADLVHSPELLGRVLRLHASHLGVEGKDLRAVASAWSLDYLGMLLPPVAAAASVLQHGFPVAADQVWVRLGPHAHPLSFHIRELGQPQRGATTEERYSALLRQHLEPLFSALCRLTGIAAKILWGNAARNLEPVLDQALALTGRSPPIAGDRQQLLHNPAWPAWSNPLPGRQREIRVRLEGRERTVKLHRQCCLFHLLPREGYCGACPLSPAHR